MCMWCVTVLQWKCSLAISKWRKWKLGHRFLRFYVFWHDTSKKRKKSCFFLIFKKNVKKNVFSNYGHGLRLTVLNRETTCLLTYKCFITSYSGQLRWHSLLRHGKRAKCQSEYSSSCSIKIATNYWYWWQKYRIKLVSRFYRVTR